jgi:carbonic anhydrase/acetyltransferase-like protein (isoleucine patch superfamily)
LRFWISISKISDPAKAASPARTLIMPLYALDEVSPRLAAGVWIAPDAQVIGDVCLGSDTSIWFGAVLRGDNERLSLGPRSNIQDGAILHTDLGYPLEVGEGCTIGHRAILHGCLVGANTLIGMGATILNGANVGRNCLVGANALLTEGKAYPDNSLILGAPARVVRELTAAEIGKLRESAAGYVANARRYQRGLAVVREARLSIKA